MFTGTELWCSAVESVYVPVPNSWYRRKQLSACPSEKAAPSQEQLVANILEKAVGDALSELERVRLSPLRPARAMAVGANKHDVAAPGTITDRALAVAPRFKLRTTLDRDVPYEKSCSLTP